MDLLFLGTSSGTPTKTRNVSGVAVIDTNNKSWVLVDCGEGTQHQLLHTKLSLNNLQAILITHVHGDHSYGLPGLIASAGLNGRKEPLLLVAPKKIKDWIDSTLSCTDMHLPFDIEFQEVSENIDLKAGNFQITVTELSHRVPSYAYSLSQEMVKSKLDTTKLQEKEIPQGQLWGEIQRGNNIEHDGQTYSFEEFLSTHTTEQKIIVAGDNDKPELLKEACKEADVLVHEATFTKEHVEKTGASHGHSYAEQVAEFAADMALPNLVLTHFSARFQGVNTTGPGVIDIYKEALNKYQGNLIMAEDFDRYRLESKSLVKV